jgi:hypothetical protein
MSTFTLPAGCRMYITASMQADAGGPHRWTVTLLDAEAGAEAGPRAMYGSRIGKGQSQRIDAPPVPADCVCEVLSNHETDEGWAPDLAEVTLRTAEGMSIRFRRPLAATGIGVEPEACVLAFRFHPPIAA